MSKADPASHKKERNKTIRWVVTIFLTTIVISGIISLVSEEIMAVSGTAVAFVILVRHIDTGHIHTGKHQLTQHVGIVGRRPQCADNFGSSSHNEKHFPS